MPRVGRPPKQPVARNNSGADSEGGSSEGGSDFPKSSSSPYVYTAPQWLLEKQTQKYFSVPIPGVSQQLRVAIEDQVSKDGAPNRKSHKKSTKLLHQVRQFQQDLQAQRQKVKIQKEKLAASMATKEDKLNELRKARESEIVNQLQDLELILRKKQEKKYKEEEEKVRNQIVEKFNKDYDEELKLKRKQREEDLEAKANEEELKEQEQDEKRQKTGETKKSDAIQENIEEAKSKAEKLTEMKSEMVWLLKQVIKAEMKKKMGLKKKEASN